MRIVNLNDYSFAEWVQFAFDHPISDPEWYWDDELRIESRPEITLNYATHLFNDPESLLEQYSVKQVKQGLTFIVYGLELDSLIWDERIVWNLRQGCIQSMVTLSARLFVKDSIEDTCFMWWDWFRDFEKGQDEGVKDAMLDALSHIIKIETSWCQASALHGLGHLDHPDKQKVIDEYLLAHPSIDEDTKLYALAAKEGRVL